MWGHAAPILCYHHIADDLSTRTSEFTVTAAALSTQIRVLRRLGFRSYTLRELTQAYEQELPVRDAIVLTFDDGYRDTYATAAPILEAHGFKGTVFAVTGYVGRRMQRGGAPTFASWDELRALRDRGWEIGLHTATHADLGTARAGTLRHEVLAAARVLELELSEPVWSVAYPWGKYSPAAIDAVIECGARAAVTVSRSLATPASPRYALPRYAVRGGDTLLDFILAVATGYGPKSVVRFVRARGTRLARGAPVASSDPVREGCEWWQA